MTPPTWEPITTHPEGGWIAPGRCGRPHLVGRAWAWWQCPVCLARTERSRVTRRQRKDAA